jgi:hypothetical protein
MPSKQERNKIARVVDANANRFREGLRVVEEIARLVLNSVDLTSTLKEKRHAVQDLVSQLPISQETLLSARNSEEDVGLKEVFDETTREDCEDILRANMRRSQESCRVLEEFSKVFDQKTPVSFKKIRFELYTLEKEIIHELKKNQHETC